MGRINKSILGLLLLISLSGCAGSMPHLNDLIPPPHRAVDDQITCSADFSKQMSKKRCDEFKHFEAYKMHQASIQNVDGRFQYTGGTPLPKRFYSEYRRRRDERAKIRQQVRQRQRDNALWQQHMQHLRNHPEDVPAMIINLRPTVTPRPSSPNYVCEVYAAMVMGIWKRGFRGVRKSKNLAIARRMYQKTKPYANPHVWAGTYRYSIPKIVEGPYEDFSYSPRVQRRLISQQYNRAWANCSS